MATATTNVQLNVTGNAQQQLQKIQKQVDGLGSAFSKLRNVVGGLAIGAMVTNMFRAADAITDLADATNLSVTSILALRQAFQLSGGDAEGAETAILKLTGSIQEAADGNDNLIEAFEKVGVSLQDLGTLSEQEITNKVIKGLGQLGNGAEAVAIKMLLLGKNARSLDVKKFADQYNLLGKSLKDTEPGLKAAGQIFDNLQKFKGDFGAALAKQFSGLLTTLEKLTSNTESLAESLAQVVKILALAGTAYVIFAKILPGMKTLGDALFGGGKNAKFFGSQIRYIIMNIKSLPKNIAAFVLSLVGLKDILASTAGKAGGLKSLSAALLNVLRIGFRFAGLAAIIGTVATALNFLIKMITGFDVLDWLGEKLSKVIDKFKEFAGLLLAGDTNYFKDTAEDVELTADMLQEVTSEAANTRDRLKGIREENERFIKSVQDVTKAYKEQNAETLQSLGNDIKYLSMTEEQIALDKNRIALHKEFLSVLDELGKKREEALADPSKRSSGVVEQIDAEIKKVQESAVVTQTESAKKIKAYYAEVAALKDVQNAIEDQARAFTQAEKLQDLQDQLSLIGLYGEELEKQKTILEAEKALREEMQSLSIELLKLEADRVRLGEEAYQKERARVVQQMMDTKTLAEAKIKAYEEEQDKKRKIDESYAEGATRALKEIADQYKPINVAQDAVRKGWDKIGDAIDTFVETGKFSFSDFARSVIADLAKMIAKALIFKAISSALGAFGLSLPGMAEGGPVKAGKGYLVGEKGPELFVPPGSGKIVPNKDLQGNGKGSSNTVAAPITNNYITNNINAVDAKSVAALFYENRKSLLGATSAAQKELPYGMRG